MHAAISRFIFEYCASGANWSGLPLSTLSMSTLSGHGLSTSIAAPIATPAIAKTKRHRCWLIRRITSA